MPEREQQFKIQPHPAKDNVPPHLGAGLNNRLEPRGGPYIPSQDKISNLGAPLNREELRKRANELNKEV